MRFLRGVVGSDIESRIADMPVWEARSGWVEMLDLIAKDRFDMRSGRDRIIFAEIEARASEESILDLAIAKCRGILAAKDYRHSGTEALRELLALEEQRDRLYTEKAASIQI